MNRRALSTEQQNPSSMELDTKSVSEILEIINIEDHSVAEAVKEILPKVEHAVVLAEDAIKKGRRVIYIGAGTSGRLGVLDAAECPPTFSAPPDLFRGVIAGGEEALWMSVEGAEDLPEHAEIDLQSVGMTTGDLVIGIASSGTTPYVLHALKYAKEQGCATVFLICNAEPLIEPEVDVLIAVSIGREVITGSTRMKSGTATKMILNMISTATMVRMGKVYGNLMVDLKAVNDKLLDRGTRIISQLTGLEYDSANDLLHQAEKEVKTAIVMHHSDCDPSAARELLRQAGGFLRSVLED
ncbi:MAG: N-acetylmuramic acid 6-phosphate etherase [Candidatus Neomarinimicrobiota bacterium]|nr:N-acetylmuramic acid 6-phosphate etherase [Candidatus Neomarinimicrobiota bacterium]